MSSLCNALSDHERAPGHALGIEYRVVTCTGAEAQDMLDYFRSTADVLTTLGDARAGACAVAVDNLRLALGLRGSSPRANTGSRSRSHSAPVMGHGPRRSSSWAPVPAAHSRERA
jgi:hypothetical protein